MTPSGTPVPARRVGPSGLLVSAVGLGCNNFGRPGTRSESLAGTVEVLDAAIDAGVTFLDTADMYGGEPGLSETLMGEALQGRRDRVVLATKFGHPGRDMGYTTTASKGSRSYVRVAVEASLTRLQTDWIDLYQLHVPDPSTPIEETVSVLDDLVARGQDPLLRPLEPRRLADRRSGFHRAGARRSLHLRAEPLQPSRPGRRTGGASGG